MKGDFTRDTFDPLRHFSRVLMQQGRVQLDANWNEQVSIFLYHLRTLAADLIGPHGGPADRLGFKIVPDGKDFTIGRGHYYVHGILCENERPISYTQQAGYPFPDCDDFEIDEQYLVYLDVWERHITHVVEPGIREVALDGPDTATRSQVVWQVKAIHVDEPTDGDDEDVAARIKELEAKIEELHQALERAKEIGNAAAVQELEREIAQTKEILAELSHADTSEGRLDCLFLLMNKLRALGRLGNCAMRARAYVEETPDDPCIIQPQARYRGAENQLYRVEIHTPGEAGEATFKWSRDNGSIIFPIRSLESDDKSDTTTVALEHLGRDDRFSLQTGDWVEIVDDDAVLRGSVERLLRVTRVDRVDMKVQLEGTLASNTGEKEEKHPFLRRWDHEASIRKEKDSKGCVILQEGKWLELEDGIQIAFYEGGTYGTGDYWLIPARTITGDVEWPGPRDDPRFQRPRGIRHYYAPLWRIAIAEKEEVKATEDGDCRRRFERLAR